MPDFLKLALVVFLPFTAALSIAASPTAEEPSKPPAAQSDTAAPTSAEILATQSAIKKEGPRVPNEIYKKIVPVYVTKRGKLTDEGEAIIDREYPNSFEITIAGAPMTVTRIGDGPQGVIIFGHSGSKQMAKYLKTNTAGLGDLLPSKISLFLFAYPTQTPPFDQVDSTIEDFTKNNNKSAFLAFPGVASSVVEQVKKASGLHQLLIIANSLGTGIVLQDYAALAADKSLSFLLVSPTAAFMPPANTIPPLQRTAMIGATGEDYADDGRYSSQDRFLEGKEGQPGSEKWEWFRKNVNLDWCELLTKSGAAEPEKIVGNLNFGKPNDFTGGHKTIGAEIDAELLARLIRVTLGWSDKAILAEPPKQR